MPWTVKAKRFLLSKGSPLKPDQKQKMITELHANPAMGHAVKGKPLRTLMKVPANAS